LLTGRSAHAHDIKGDTAITGTTLYHIALKDAGGVNSPVGLGIYDVTSYDVKRAGSLSQVPFIGGKTILGLLRDIGAIAGYPVAEGETFMITGAKQAEAIQMVLYEIYDAGDQTSDMPNGSKATEYIFLNYGDSGAAINKTGDTIYDRSVSPAEFPDFPYGKDVPAKTEIDLIGILGSDFAPKENDGTNYCITKYLKLIRERIVLFDEDRNGLLLYSPFKTALGNVDMVGEGVSVIGNYSSVDYRNPLIFPEPIVFRPGE